MSSIKGRQWFRNETFEVKRISRDEVLYKCAAHEVLISCDDTRDGDEYLQIHLSYVKQWEDGAMITTEERAVLREHLMEACATLQIPFELK